MLFPAAAPSMLFASEKSSTDFDNRQDLLSQAITRPFITNSLRLKFVKKLISSNVKINGQDSRGNTPLILATERQEFDTDMIKLLLQHNANIHDKNLYGCTPLGTAVAGRDLIVVKLLFDNHANPNSKERTKTGGYATPLEIALRSNFSEIVALLSGNKFDELGLAIDQGSLETVKILLERGIGSNGRDSIGNTPLICATRQKKPDIIKLLLQCKADINDKNVNGCTALGFSVSQNDLKIAELLLAKNADPLSVGTKRNGKSCSSPLKIAEKYNYSAMIELLRGSEPVHESETDDDEYKSDEAE